MVQPATRADGTDSHKVAERTPLNNAIECGDYGILIRAQRQNFQDSEGKAPLHWAAERENLEIVNALLLLEQK
ncbi:MAG: ankyrin repeat domain-containing protein [Holosporales bacterium]|nr:ankyrin repeat domain-containing protein [Holosporales bacterium]